MTTTSGGCDGRGTRGATPAAMLLLFAAAREAAGVSRLEIRGATVAEVLDEASVRFGEPFVSVLGRSRVWVNGVPARPDDQLADGDEVAVLPPVSGG